ncbi:coenzyme F420-dependent N5,N10-methylene tetrahydromethanopterin reductase and related flavin-dependent oxidoreductases [Pseudonocardia sp. N23]|nr:coenzyme F420-dependent N5,N10-methylene tetrahydromethanopterin reductase and related flavin-dependent oxidoreductases [Pseudonocardia sp. N23]
MHLVGFSLWSPSAHMVGSWRHPESHGPGMDWASPELWQRIAQDCERGKMDGFFFAVGLAPYGVYQDSIAPTLRDGIQFPSPDAMLLLPMMAAATERLGLVSTLSTTYNHPYAAVRQFSTLDHLTKGRVGWNVVTSFQPREAEAHGMDPIPHAERYERAAEYMEICHEFWDSWDADAVVEDRENGVWADPDKVRDIDYSGTYYRAKGTGPMSPSPQGKPVIFQAGGSENGRDFCARWSDAALSFQMNVVQMKAFVDDMNARAEKFGRTADQLKSFFGVQPIIGLSEAEAREKQDYLNGLVPPDGSLALLSGHTAFDFSTLDLDAPAEEIPDMPGIRGIWGAVTSLADHGLDAMTIREGARAYGQSVLMPQLVGTPQQVADELISLWEESDGDGFLVTCPVRPGGYAEFSDLVVPILQKAKVYRHDYEGSTFREHLAQTTLS